MQCACKGRKTIAPWQDYRCYNRCWQQQKDSTNGWRKERHESLECAWKEKESEAVYGYNCVQNEEKEGRWKTRTRKWKTAEIVIIIIAVFHSSSHPTSRKFLITTAATVVAVSFLIIYNYLSPSCLLVLFPRPADHHGNQEGWDWGERAGKRRKELKAGTFAYFLATDCQFDAATIPDPILERKIFGKKDQQQGLRQQESKAFLLHDATITAIAMITISCHTSSKMSDSESGHWHKVYLFINSIVLFRIPDNSLAATAVTNLFIVKSCGQMRRKVQTLKRDEERKEMITSKSHHYRGPRSSRDWQWVL